MVSFSMKVDGVEEVSRWFDTVSDRVKNPQAALREVSDIERRSIEKNYSTQGRPRWAQRKGTYAHPILWETGLKRETEIQSTMQPWQKQGKGWVLQIYSTYYGFYHSYKGHGQVVRKSTIPQPHEITEMYASLLAGFFRTKIIGISLKR